MEKPNKKSVRILTTKQAKIISKMKNNSVKKAVEELGITPDAIYMSNTRVYQKFIGLLNVVLENYPVFERRFKKNKTAYRELRQLARLVKGESKFKEKDVEEEPL